MNRRAWSWRRLAVGGVVAGVIICCGLVLYFGSLLARPVRGSAGPIPDDPPMQAVSFSSESGSTLEGWFARREKQTGGVVLLHGIRANRRSMLGRARFLYDAGYSVLVFDLQAHGESDGERITFGFLESLDARAAVRFLRDRLPGEPVAAIGSSLGGAACVLGADPIDVDVLVLEAVYPDVGTAIRNRLRLRYGRPGEWLAPLLTFQIKPRMGIDVEDLSPLRNMEHIQAPVLVMSGELDQRTTVEDSRQLFDAAPQPKYLWIVPGARHVDFHRHAGSLYEDKVLRFLHLHMGGTG